MITAIVSKHCPAKAGSPHWLVCRLYRRATWITVIGQLPARGFLSACQRRCRNVTSIAVLKPRGVWREHNNRHVVGRLGNNLNLQLWPASVMWCRFKVLGGETQLTPLRFTLLFVYSLFYGRWVGGRYFCACIQNAQLWDSRSTSRIRGGSQNVDGKYILLQCAYPADECCSRCAQPQKVLSTGKENRVITTTVARILIIRSR